MLRHQLQVLQRNRGRIFVVDTVSGDSHEAIEGESLNLPILTANTSKSFFTRRASRGDIWVVRFGETTATTLAT